ncbi:hypothetical protein [Rhodoblastus sp.]|uniref:hypothetical protein n=1 Tax=Rhodoblastus sp. TaxID=1962975 RepID=UPI003F9805D6
MATPNATEAATRGRGGGSHEFAKLPGLQNSDSANSTDEQDGASIEPTRLRHLARRLHALGERPLYELMRELVAGADPVARIEVYCRMDPAILCALGGDVLPAMMTAIDGGRQ